MVASIDALLAALMTFMLFSAESISEAGYKQPDCGGEPYTNKAEVPSGFLKSTAKLDQPLALKKARTVHGGDCTQTHTNNYAAAKMQQHTQAYRNCLHASSRQ